VKNRSFFKRKTIVEGNNLVVFYYLIAFESWSDKRGALWWAWLYKKGGLWWV